MPAAASFTPGNSANAVRVSRQISAWVLAAAVLLAGAWRAGAQDAAHLSIIVPGGVPGMPTMTGATRVTNGLNVTWTGPSGYYQLYQRPALQGSTWQPIGTPYNLNRNATITTLQSNAFFRVSGPPPNYAGSQTCAECHSETLNTVIHTEHFGAFNSARFISDGGQTNTSCLPCHTVGYGLPTGFVSAAATPQLEGVQCENCHGPAANHAANPGDPTAIPQVELAGTMCGGCHNTRFIPSSPPGPKTHIPGIYEEWSASPHPPVVPAVAQDFAGSRGTSFYIPTCGRCHSAPVRHAFLKNLPLPDAQEASTMGVVCATCHDPHETFTFTNVLSGVITNPVTGAVVTNGTPDSTYTLQIRNPLSSIQDYHTLGDFSTNYNPAINLCAQCHNDRGETYTDSDRAPHHSLQYNMLIGTTGVLATNLDTNPSAPPHFEPASHALFITNQCVGCHMQTAPSPGPGQPPYEGHLFLVNSYGVCASCHGSAETASNLVLFVQAVMTNEIQVTLDLLDQWALEKAPAILGTTNFGALAWEYTSPGELSPSGSGPNSTQQQLIPANIKGARFNLYQVFHDGSFGVHNPLYSLALFDTAQKLVKVELAKPPPEDVVPAFAHRSAPDR